MTSGRYSGKKPFGSIIRCNYEGFVMHLCQGETKLWFSWSSLFTTVLPVGYIHLIVYM